MIGKYVEFFIVCDGCDVEGSNTESYSWVLNPERENLGNYPLQGFAKKCDLIKEAKKFGWVFKDKKSFCPKCSARSAGGARRAKT